MQPNDLLETAQKLLDSEQKKPRQADLRRAMSTLYYAAFLTLAQNCADTLIGKTHTTRNSKAWQQVYRALDHRMAKQACDRNEVSNRFPRFIVEFAEVFSDLQDKRHSADYDPGDRLTKSQVEIEKRRVRSALHNFNRASLADRKAFAAFVLFKLRKT